MTIDPYPPIQQQDPIVELLPNLFLLRGSTTLAPGVTIGRNMIILRDKRDLTLISSVRMTLENESRLEELGSVRHLVRIGFAHGMDDAYAASRFGAQFWCLEGADSTHSNPVPDVIFDAQQELPFLNADLFPFDGFSGAEVALIWRENDGVLITSDALQNYGDWRFFNLLSRLIHPLLGFSKGMIVGPAWHRLFTTDEIALRRSFSSLLDEDFHHMIGAHGTFCRDVAHDQVGAAVSKEFDHGPAMSNLALRVVRSVLVPELK